MLEKIKIEDILFIDIETVPAEASFENLNERMKHLWEVKTTQFNNNENFSPEELYFRAGIFAEFGKIICISAGFVVMKNGQKYFRLKSFADNNEATLLQDFATTITKFSQQKEILLCAHNGKEFDFPYISRRMLINGIKLPAALDNAGKKPWDIKHLDTLELWKFGDYKHYTSLNLLTAIFNIPTPKDDISGADVAKVFYELQNLNRIVTYCQKDVVAIAQIMLRFKGETLIPEENIQIAE